MKIENTGPVKPTTTQRTRQTGGAKQSEFATHIQQSNVSPSVQGPALSTSTEGLWFLQEISDHEHKRRQTYNHGESVLESLESLRLDILSGNLPVSRLLALRNLLAQHKQSITDEKLLEIIHEIELRAWVELAKLGL